LLGTKSLDLPPQRQILFLEPFLFSLELLTIPVIRLLGPLIYLDIVPPTRSVQYLLPEIR
jgi:hypothetical protein